MRMEDSKRKGLWPPVMMRRDLLLQYSLTLGQGGKYNYPAGGRGIIILYSCIVHGTVKALWASAMSYLSKRGGRCHSALLSPARDNISASLQCCSALLQGI